MKIFIGYDSRENEVFRVCKHSLEIRSANPLEIEPLSSGNPMIDRPWAIRDGQRVDLQDGRPFSTEFSFARFLVPFLMGFQGWAMFVDSDFLFLDDVQDLFKLADDSKAVMVVPHDHTPQESVKMDGCKQDAYKRKNWSSLVLWNCGHKAHRVPRKWPTEGGISLERLNTFPGAWWHYFTWLKWEEIGFLPESWNWLEGHSPKEIIPSAVHYTRGGPWWKEYQDCDYADLWLSERDEMLSLERGEKNAASF